MAFLSTSEDPLDSTRFYPTASEVKSMEIFIPMRVGFLRATFFTTCRLPPCTGRKVAKQNTTIISRAAHPRARLHGEDDL